MIERTALIPLKPISPTTSISSQRVGAKELTDQFSTFLQEAIHNASEQQNVVDTLSNQFITGELADVHKLLIATEKSALGLELTMQIRNKAIEAYQEIMRTQI